VTRDNGEESSVRNWYKTWTRETKAKDPFYTVYAEIKYFGVKFLHDEDYQSQFVPGRKAQEKWDRLYNCQFWKLDG
jgi:hypothetical protein